MTRSDIITRIGELQTVLDECEVILNGRDSAFWQIIRRIYEAQIKSYRASTRQAAEAEDRSIRNFIGKEEGIEWAIDVVELDFLDQAKRAKSELTSLQAQLKELEEIDRGVDSLIQDPMYQQPGTI